MFELVREVGGETDLARTYRLHVGFLLAGVVLGAPVALVVGAAPTMLLGGGLLLALAFADYLLEREVDRPFDLPSVAPVYGLPELVPDTVHRLFERSPLGTVGYQFECEHGHEFRAGDARTCPDCETDTVFFMDEAGRRVPVRERRGSSG